MPSLLLTVGQFVVRGQELPTAYVRAKFEDVALSVCEILAHFAALH